ncbi:response regulator [Sulfurimonas sp. HSL-1656]|uniref:response regulator transcription factor n=1 Tax=Thiomicrolovo subterrani TaxID=3131934 RepID=UPI0031F8CC0B
MESYKVMIVEDDPVTAMNLQIALENQGYEVAATVDSSIQAPNKIKVYEPDIVLVDISLQEDADGIELAKYIREKHALPFIYLTAHSDANIIDEAKQTEPYGYIVKPFDPESLHATIQMAMYKYHVEKEREENMEGLKNDKLNLEKLLYNKKLSDKPIVPFGDDYYLDISVCETFYHGKKIKLTKKENAFMRLLVAQLGLVVSFDQAINYVWEEKGATENSVRTLVWRLRNKLPTDIIQNASGIGYYIED